MPQSVIAIMERLNESTALGIIAVVFVTCMILLGLVLSIWRDSKWSTAPLRYANIAIMVILAPPFVIHAFHVAFSAEGGENIRRVPTFVIALLLVVGSVELIREEWKASRTANE